jgi:hypothetical protein
MGVYKEYVNPIYPMSYNTFMKIIDDGTLDELNQMATLMDEYVKIGKLKRYEKYDKFVDLIPEYKDQAWRAIKFKN